MKLRELLEVYENDMSITQDHEIGVSGSTPVFQYHLTSGAIPAELLDREIKHMQAGVTRKYDRPHAVLQVHLKGFKTLSFKQG